MFIPHSIPHKFLWTAHETRGCCGHDHHMVNPRSVSDWRHVRYIYIVRDHILFICLFLLLLSDNPHLRSSNSTQCRMKSPLTPVMYDSESCSKWTVTTSKTESWRGTQYFTFFSVIKLNHLRTPTGWWNCDFSTEIISRQEMPLLGHVCRRPSSRELSTHPIVVISRLQGCLTPLGGWVGNIQPLLTLPRIRFFDYTQWTARDPSKGRRFLTQLNSLWRCWMFALSLAQRFLIHLCPSFSL